jgi:bacillithiol biosynthesis cysteine-adding enzyme BshC
MKATYIDYSETNSFSNAVIRYLDQDPELAPFISYQPTVEGFARLLENKKVVADRQVLVNVLREQYAGMANDPTLNAVAENIRLLSLDSTFTITTGHQLNLFTGPLYFIFKIATAIKLAKDLKIQFPAQNFVPVYWMATEDHDFEEINHTYIGGKKIEWLFDAKGATGRLSTKDIIKAVKEYTAVLGVSQNADKLCQIIESAYLDHPTLASATRYLVTAIFKDYGLVILDADHIELKKQFSDIIQQDITRQNSYKNITSSIEKLASAGLQAQVHPREINFFYLQDELRERLVYENGQYHVLNTAISFSESQLNDEINSHPERFSPNVVMRPLYQELILPNIAYVGGGAEVVYWLELKENFQYYKIDFPILVLRNSALMAGSKFGANLKKLGLSAPELFLPCEELKKHWVIRNSVHTLNLEQELQEFKELFANLKLRVHRIDPTLAVSTETLRARLERAIHNLEKKLIRAEKRNYSESLNRIGNMKQSLFPKAGLQERSENFGLFYVRYGNDFIASLIESFKPLEFKFTILQEENITN